MDSWKAAAYTLGWACVWLVLVTVAVAAVRGATALGRIADAMDPDKEEGHADEKKDRPNYPLH